MKRLLHLILGPPGVTRTRVSMTLLGLAVYLLYALLQALEVSFGMIDAAESNLLACVYVAGGVLFYLMVRLGWAERIGARPGLARVQLWFGVACSIWAYAITGPVRGAVISSTMLVLVFAMFTQRAREVRRMTFAALAGYLVVMAWNSIGPAARYPAAHEAIHFMFAAILLGGVAALSIRMSRLRGNLVRQAADLENALEQIRLLATRDELTGLFNRRHMTTLLQEEHERQRRLGTAMSLALVDIDLFKRVNDSHGHAAGDAVLKAFAGAASAVMRSTDALARWGGEEFLLMMPATDLVQAHHAVERIRASLAQTDFSHVALGLAPTFSAGLSACAPEDDIEAAIEHADQAMYRAKTDGRNCTRSV